MKLVITKFNYLKTPKYSWTVFNSQGGSFSNSGMHQSLIAVLKHAQTINKFPWDKPFMLEVIEGFDADDNAVVITAGQSYLGKYTKESHS